LSGIVPGMVRVSEEAEPVVYRFPSSFGPHGPTQTGTLKMRSANCLGLVGVTGFEPATSWSRITGPRSLPAAECYKWKPSEHLRFTLLPYFAQILLKNQRFAHIFQAFPCPSLPQVRFDRRRVVDDFAAVPCPGLGPILLSAQRTADDVSAADWRNRDASRGVADRRAQRRSSRPRLLMARLKSDAPAE
jgi:hypothetical protein